MYNLKLYFNRNEKNHKSLYRINDRTAKCHTQNLMIETVKSQDFRIAYVRILVKVP